MKDLLKAWVISVTFATMPLNVEANDFGNGYKDFQNQTNVQLSNALNSQDDKEILSFYVDFRIIIKAILDYFDEEVKMYKLSQKAREKVVPILNSYLLAHPVLVIGNEGRMSFVIDDKMEFCRVVKQLVNIIIDDIPFFVKKVWVPLLFWGENSLQQKLNNLWNTVMDMKEKQYKDVVFDYVWWIVKRVAKSVNWKMTVKQYYDDINRYFPNKNSAKISQELVSSWNWNLDIKYMKYPFKK